MARATSRHERNKTRHEYEIQAGSSHLGPMWFVGYTEQAAILKAVDMLLNNDIWRGREETHCRLYHTHPSPGPVRRYVGIISREGTLRRAS